jgi:hypothetical protein
MNRMQDSGTKTVDNSLDKFKYLGTILTNQNCIHKKKFATIQSTIFPFAI